ncbi:MAG: phosphatase PAP2 family protein [Candidatus Methanoperedens sp.]|nr:phosphatase PAP2 family protein [Candidatus Methanoperedens sp.]MCZ7358723.1 phosphatase PAP2 family protein [Candidatus Methanoperedens sp.]HLB72352.1 phosphatase PAP2 family protein [Candidatus Methanoperedens sp.]
MLLPFQLLFNENINIYLQSLGNPAADRFFIAITSAGSQPVYFLLATLIFWCFSKQTGIRLMYVVLFSASLSIFAKNLFAMPRPPEYLHKIQENGFGFPSGHAQVSSGCWGYLGWKIRDFFVIIAAVMIISISLSRVYLGVHYAGDVLGGIIFGLFIAFVFLRAELKVENILKKLDNRSKFFFALIPPVILVVLAALQQNLLENQIEIGLVMGSVGAGYLLEEKYVRLQDVKDNIKKLKRSLIGISLLLIVYFILKLLLSLNPIFIFFEYAVMGLASVLMAPLVFSRLEANSKNRRQ